MEENKKTRKTTLTPGKVVGKYVIKRKEPSHFLQIVNESGGSVPQSLSGLFTTAEFAQTAIKSYLTKQRKGD